MSDLSRWATWREIHAQPRIWSDWAGQLDAAGLRDWVSGLGVEEVWFSGAGTSAYIGDILVAGLEGLDGPRLRSVASTDLVSRPQAHLARRRPLVVSFGRSGNSTESLGTLDVLDALAPEAPRLNITCNPDGALATRPAPGPARTVILPEATHDAGFAMTSSFSTMLLTAWAIFGPDDVTDRFDRLGNTLRKLLPRYADAGPPPARAVYLGTGPQAFAAREAALKVMELSAGRIPALWDSTLGFRHGPKSFVTRDTAITLFRSAEAPARHYEDDLVDELRAQFPEARLLTIGPGGEIAHDETGIGGAALNVAQAQVAGVLWSEALGLNVDDPFAGQGTLSRVVSGVTLYPVAS